jgi:hypothetical protein
MKTEKYFLSGMTDNDGNLLYSDNEGNYYQKIGNTYFFYATIEEILLLQK